MRKKILDEMFMAIYRGDVEVVRDLLLKGVKAASTDPIGDPWLTTACTISQESVVALLIASGADANAVSPDGNFPLRMASDNVGITRRLLAAGADVEHRFRPKNKGFVGRPEEIDATPIILAAKGGGGHSAVLELLLEAGADVNARSINGATALIWTVKGTSFIRTGVVKTLIEAGADLDLRDKNGYTALMYVMAEHLVDVQFDTPERSDTSTILDMLQNAGASDSGVEHVELGHAVADGDRDRVQKLIAVGADVNIASPRGEIPLTWAVYEKNYEMVEYLLKVGADVNATPPNRNAETPLVAAVKNRDLEMAQVLVDAGADLAAEGPFGTALDYAARMDAKILKYLKSHKSKPMTFQYRGLATEDKDQSIVLIRSALEAVTAATEALAASAKALRDVHDQPVAATAECYVTYQLAGHDWTCIHPARATTGKSLFGPKMAKRLSQALNTKAIFYENDDNVVYTGYELFEDGKSAEYVYMGPKDCEAAFQWKPGPHALGDDDEDVVKVRSKRRKLKKSDVEFDADFIHNFFVAEDAYVPPWSNRELRITGKSKRYFSKMDRDVFVRVDFITF